MLVWRLRGKIIRIAPFCVVYDSCAHLDEQMWAVLTVLWIGFCHMGPFHYSLICSCLSVMYFVFVLFHPAYVLYYCEHGEVDLMGLKPNH